MEEVWLELYQEISVAGEKEEFTRVFDSCKP